MLENDCTRTAQSSCGGYSQRVHKIVFLAVSKGNVLVRFYFWKYSSRIVLYIRCSGPVVKFLNKINMKQSTTRPLGQNTRYIVWKTWIIFKMLQPQISNTRYTDPARAPNIQNYARWVFSEVKYWPKYYPFKQLGTLFGALVDCNHHAMTALFKYRVSLAWIWIV